MAFSHAQDQSGNWWVSVTHNYGAASFTWGVPVDNADELADQFAAGIKAAAADARRRASGLVVPE